jgi:UDP-glucose:(heptosyl)LPS alpha-1,3-glucosyltransferase
MNKLNIAIIHKKYRPDGGAERFAARTFAALAQQGLQLTLVTRHGEISDNYRLIQCNPFFIGRLWRDWGFERVACKTLTNYYFDLVQSHERVPCCHVYRAGDGVHQEWLRQRKRTLGKFRRLLLDWSLYHRYVNWADQRMFKSPHLKAVICNSKMVRDEIMDYFNPPPELLHVIYSGVDTQGFHPNLKIHRDSVRRQLNIPLNSTLFLFVGSGFERKGLAAAIKALAQVSAHLLVVGKDKRMSHYRRLCVQKGIAGRVHFLGVQQDVKPYYGAADALVLPSLYDPFANVVLEAMACGLPVVTSTKCGGAELISEGQNGYVSDALDIDRLSYALNQLENQAHCQTLGENARETVKPYSLSAMSDHLLRLYKKLLDNRVVPK